MAGPSRNLTDALGSLAGLKIGATAGVSRPVGVRMTPVGAARVASSSRPCLASWPAVLPGERRRAVNPFGNLRFPGTSQRPRLIRSRFGLSPIIGLFSWLRRLGHALELLVDLAGAVSGLGELGSLGEGLADGRAGVGDL